MGDLGKFDEHGNLIIVGRKKDMIIRGGQNIYPVEIENLLLTHDKVSAVAVVGMKDPIMAEKVCAYVVPRMGERLTFEEMVSFLKSKNIAPYKLPERLEILDSLPLVSGQKVDKKALEKDIARKLEEEANL
jgi:non-ribosomal peptide synthetase component E (peptide arylation enzyme)